jgi:3-oxoacyl-[acyl-carrier-protein] synthase-3
VNYACPTHRLLELPRNCVAIPTTTACNAFATHATLARALVASGQARHVLSIHSSALTRIGVSAEPDSAWWGDGAAAVVFGPVSDGRGITAVVNKTDGATCDAIVIGVQGRRWWEDGPSTMYHGNRDHTRAMLFGLVDRARDTITESMSAAELGPANLDFYASHQGTVWFTELTAELAGLARVPTLVTFPTLCNLTSVNIPMILALAEQKGMIRDGSNIVTFAGGVGETWSSICLRWGR